MLNENILNNEYISIALFLTIPVRTIKQKTDVDIESSRLGWIISTFMITSLNMLKNNSNIL